MQSVRGVVQIVNDRPVPTIPRNYSELRDWYSEVNGTLLRIQTFQLLTLPMVEFSGFRANCTDRYFGEWKICKEARDLCRRRYVYKDNGFDSALHRAPHLKMEGMIPQVL